MQKNIKHTPLFKPVYAAVLSAVCTVIPNIANATCTGLNTANVICTGTASSSFQTQPTGSSTVTLIDWINSNGRFSNANFGPELAGSTQTIIGNNINMTNNMNNGTVIAAFALAPAVNFDIKIKDSILTANSNVGAVSADGNGDVSLKLTDTIIKTTLGQGVNIASHNGNVSFEMTGGSISNDSTGSESVHIYINTDNGHANAVTHGGSITNNGQNSMSNAFYVGAFNPTSTLSVDNNSTLHTVMSAIVTEAENGLSTVTNSGEINMIKTDPNNPNVPANFVTSAIHSIAVDGDIQINNSGAITTVGANSSGIRAQTTGTGNIVIENSGDISTNGLASHGIYAETVTGNVDIINNGNLNIHGVGVGSKGIYVKTANNATTNVTNNATIKHDAPSSFQYGIEVVGGTNSNITINNNGVVEGSSFGIVAWNGGSAHSNGQSTINIGSQGVVNAIYGITVDMSARNTINIANGGLVNGKINAIQLRGNGAATPADTVNNSGTITSGRDKILSTTFAASGASIAFNNKADGQMTGVLNASNANTTINNEGIWNLRQLEDTNADGTRELLSVAVTNLGSGNNQIVNSGTLNLLGDTGSATTLNNAGEYSTGYAANTMSLAGPAQGQILGLQSFTNSGMIDLSLNNTVGDVLLISGSTTAGTAGNGVYVANGGQLKIDTVLNEGGANSQSDMLVVDGTRLGNNATTVLINNLGGTGALTVDNGIEVVRVLDSARSEAGIFKLGARATAGLYEYDLYKGGVDTSVADGNWYLRSLTTPIDPVDPTKPVVPIINPESTVYLRNLNAASTMFMHTLHDRLGEPQFTDAYKTGDNNPSSAWVRVVSNHTDSTGGNGQVDLNTDTNLVHLGADIARWSNNGTDRWNIGLMGAYGQSKIDASPNVLGVTPSGFKRNATGKVDGYSVGGYATWYQNKDKPEGLYVDTWAQYGWYDNKVQGNTKAEESYNSNGWTASVEAGYAMIARDEGKNRQLMFEPQIQVAYNNYSSDDHTDASGTRITDNNANGVITRVGARLYSRSTLNDNGIQPFVEANWWYSDAKNSLAFNGETMSDGTPNSRYELKAGLQGEVAKNWLMWGHAGVQFGQNDFNRYEGMVGVKRIF